MQHLTPLLHISLSLSTHTVKFTSNPFCYVTRSVLFYQDEEEDEEDEMMSDHMKDSEVKSVPLLQDARCAARCVSAVLGP